MAQIKKDTSLRKAILQAAITGQLISDVDSASFENQNSVSERSERQTGKELLDKIIEERNNKLLVEWEEALKKNPKAKKPTPVVASEIYEDEIPFEIPENWYWCRLGDVAEIKSSKRVFEKDYVLDGVPFFRSAEIGDLQQNKALKTELFISEKHFNELKNKYGVPQQGDLLITSVGTIGNTWISDGRDFYYKDGNITQISKNEFIIPEYFRLFIDSPVFTMQVFDTVAGTAYNALTIIKLKKLIFPLPPLAVQNAIVAKLEQVLPLVDAYENALLQKEELKSALPDKVKKAILQEAITGKLTETWRKTRPVVEPVKTTETGKQLLDRIIADRNEKALAEWEEALKKNPKAKKPLAMVASEIEEDEIPFEVPESWCWCRLGDLVPFGQCENAEPNEIEDDAWILDLEDIEKDSGRILQFKTKKEVDSKSTKHVFKKGYVLYSKLRPYLNKCVIAPKDGYCTSEILPLNFGSLVNNKYAQTFLMSPYFVDYTDSLSFGVKMPRLGTEDGKKALVPLPPLAEQEEIVKKVEKLLPLCK